jgi:anti-sigma regulatory factor (Ser/Thr protein kinase)
MEPLIVTGTLDALERIRAYVDGVAARAGLNRRAVQRLVGAVDEIASNIVLHGYAKAGRAGMVQVWAEIDEQALTVVVEDNGVAYNPDLRITPDLDMSLEDREPGGLGLFLAGQKVDELRYERMGERNRHTFVVYRRAE